MYSRKSKTGTVGFFVATFEEKQHTIHYKAVVSSKISLPSSVDKIISNPISKYRLWLYETISILIFICGLVGIMCLAQRNDFP